MSIPDANDILDRFSVVSAPIPILGIARKLGVQVGGQTGVPWNIRFSLNRTVLVNVDREVRIQRMLLAQCLRHILEGRVTGCKSPAEGLYEPVDSPFARQLLVPRFLLAPLIYQGKADTEVVSEVFQVPERMAATRILEYLNGR